MPIDFSKVKIPDVGLLSGFDHAVAGHDGVLMNQKGDAFIKPATAHEIQFYELINRDPSYNDLKELAPYYFGTLELTGKEAASLEEAAEEALNKYTVPDSGHHQIGEHAPMNPKHIHTKSIKSKLGLVLDNETYGFKRPNVLDVKLGVRLWADDALQEKKDRFDKITEETTHRDLGFRMAGSKVWQGHDEPRGGDVDPKGFRIFDKNYGREDVNVDNVEAAFRTFFFEPKAGVTRELSRRVLEAFIHEVARIKAVLEKLESRMYSASILFVYEGDGEQLKQAIEEKIRVGDEAETNGSKPDADEAQTNGDKTNGEHTNGDTDYSSSSSSTDRPPRVLSCKLIDFAHARIEAGLGPDTNMLKGVDSVLKILKTLARETPATAT